jgi:hypothetical protein
MGVSSLPLVLWLSSLALACATSQDLVFSSHLIIATCYEFARCDFVAISAQSNGAAIAFTGTGTFDAHECSFISCYSTPANGYYGGAIYISSTEAVANFTRLCGRSCYAYYGFYAYLGSFSQFSMSDVCILSCAPSALSSTYYGALYVADYRTQAQMTNLTSCYTESYSSAMYLSASSYAKTLSYFTISRCVGPYAIRVAGSYVTMSHSNFVSNTASSYLIYSASGYLTLQNCVSVGNSGTEFYCSSSYLIYLYDCGFSGRPTVSWSGRNVRMGWSPLTANTFLAWHTSRCLNPYPATRKFTPSLPFKSSSAFRPSATPCFQTTAIINESVAWDKSPVLNQSLLPDASQAARSTIAGLSVRVVESPPVGPSAAPRSIAFSQSPLWSRSDPPALSETRAAGQHRPRQHSPRQHRPRQRPPRPRPAAAVVAMRRLPGR